MRQSTDSPDAAESQAPLLVIIDEDLVQCDPNISFNGKYEIDGNGRLLYSHGPLRHFLRGLLGRNGTPQHGADINKVEESLVTDGEAHIGPHTLRLDTPFASGEGHTPPSHFTIVNAPDNRVAVKNGARPFRSSKAIRIVDDPAQPGETDLLKTITDTSSEHLNHRALTEIEAQLMVGNAPRDLPLFATPIDVRLAKTLCSMQLYGFILSDTQRQLVADWQAQSQDTPITAATADPTSILLAKVLLSLSADGDVLSPEQVTIIRHFRRLVHAKTLGQYTDPHGVCVLRTAMRDAPAIQQLRNLLFASNRLAA